MPSKSRTLSIQRLSFPRWMAAFERTLTQPNQEELPTMTISKATTLWKKKMRRVKVRPCYAEGLLVPQPLTQGTSRELNRSSYSSSNSSKIMQMPIATMIPMSNNKNGKTRGTIKSRRRRARTGISSHR